MKATEKDGIVTIEMDKREAQILNEVLYSIDGTGPHCAIPMRLGIALKELGYEYKKSQFVTGKIICI